MRVSQHICETFPTMSSASSEFQLKLLKRPSGYVSTDRILPVSMDALRLLAVDPQPWRDPSKVRESGSSAKHRASYVGNSAVNFTDPSGYCFMGCFSQRIFRSISAG
jgi:hypothetical protein